MQAACTLTAAAFAIQVSWGSHSEVEAMRLLLQAALNQPLNAHFVFLCETSIPLYPPTVVYSQLIKGGKSKIDACPKADPEVCCLVPCSIQT